MRFREFWVRPPSKVAFCGACVEEPTIGGIHVIEKSAYDELADKNAEYEKDWAYEIVDLKAKLKIAIEALEKLDTGWNKTAVREALDKIKTDQKAGVE